jgi:NAD(P)-dependent dehydrogenase (short-subunit alcohol dehydrogenase family)
MADQPVPQRVALVTGGTRGLGAAITHRLAVAGITVAAAYRSDDTAAIQLRDRVGANIVSLHRVDLGEREGCRKLVDDVIDRHGRIDHLVNNAGVLLEGRVDQISGSQWEETLRVNVSSAFYLAQKVLEPMRAQRFGRIVNVGSVSASMGSPFQVDYATAKAGLIGLTRSLARAVARSGITVNCIVPGGFDTDLLNAMTLTDRQIVERSIPVGRFGYPHELAHAVASLVHDDASYITGAVVVIDGGLSMGS